MVKVPGKRYDFRVGRRWRRVRGEVLTRDGGRCHWCGGPANEADHVQPVTRGGDWYDKGNLVASCKSCNASRGNRGTVRERGGTVFSARGVYIPRKLTISLPERGEPLLRGDFTRGRRNARGA